MASGWSAIWKLDLMDRRSRRPTREWIDSLKPWGLVSFEVGVVAHKEQAFQPLSFEKDLMGYRLSFRSLRRFGELEHQGQWRRHNFGQPRQIAGTRELDTSKAQCRSTTDAASRLFRVAHVVLMLQYTAWARASKATDQILNQRRNFLREPGISWNPEAIRLTTDDQGFGSKPIRSFTADRMRCLQPRYRSVV
jgi:hypothetical protein